MKIAFLYNLELKLRNVIANLKNIPGILKIRLSVDKSNKISIPKNNYKNIKIKIAGKNNVIIIEDNNILYKAKINISIYGNNNEIRIKKGFALNKELSVVMGLKSPNFEPGVSNSKFIIDEDSSIESMNYITYNANTFFEAGKNCMFASDINIFNTDAHPVLDKETGVVLNKVKGIKIGNHCWIGNKATILKNTTIADDCIIGWGSVVSGHFDKSNCAIAGNPAKYIKSGITWDSNGSEYGYIENK